MSDDDDNDLSLTVLSDALKSGLKLDDPEVIALARAARIRIKSSTWYKVKEAVKSKLPQFAVAVITFLGITLGAIITVWSKM